MPDNFNIPPIAEIRRMAPGELDALCAQLRCALIETVAATGGHLSSNLGVVELTLALHMTFDLPHDQIVWDVGHQCYVHKLLTGRAEKFSCLRHEGGVSGFPKPSESETDVFVTGHSSTAISAANGLAKAKELTGDDGYVAAVVGDGAMTGGLAYEGLSNAGRSEDRLIVVLNDNRMSINRNVGFIARHLAKLRNQSRYVRLKKRLKSVFLRLPLIGKPLLGFVSNMKDRLKRTVYQSSTYFEEMGFYYMGPVDGHNIRETCEALAAAKLLNRPVLVHVLTVKGKGYEAAEQNPDTFHGVAGFDPETGEPLEANCDTFSCAFGKYLTNLAEQDPKICGMTAAMQGGTGIGAFAAAFPARFFDVGIAEAHAVTFSSGLAQGGMIPVFAVYSSFLQRAYDQLLNDAAIIGSHIVLAVDRAGVVPEDGETHQGLFDVAFLYTIPGVTIYAPATIPELELRLKQAVYDAKGIAAVRYPKGGELPMPVPYVPGYQPFDYFPKEGAATLAVTYGRVFANAMTAAEELAESVPVSVLKLNRIRPIDPECYDLAVNYNRVIFFEEAAESGGAGERFGERLLERGHAGRYQIVAAKGFLGVCSTESGLRQLGLDVENVKWQMANGK